MAGRKLSIFPQRVFTFLSVVSLLLCVATTALWVRSYWRYDFIGYQSSPIPASNVAADSAIADHLYLDAASCYWLRSAGGLIGFGHAKMSPHLTPGLRQGRVVWSVAPSSCTLAWTNLPPARRWTGVRYWSDPIFKSDYRQVAVAYWLVVVILSILPLHASVRHMRGRHRRHSGLCPNCGYDLRATPQRCPECGTERGFSHR